MAAQQDMSARSRDVAFAERCVEDGELAADVGDFERGCDYCTVALCALTWGKGVEDKNPWGPPTMDWRGDAMLEGCLGCGPRRGGQLDSPWTFLADRGAEERRSGDGCFPGAESRVAAAKALVARSFHHVACGRQGRAVEDAGYAFALADAGSDLAKRALVARGSAFAGQWDLKRALRDADRLAAMGDAAGARRVTCHAGCAAKEAQVAAKQRSEDGTADAETAAERSARKCDEALSRRFAAILDGDAKESYATIEDTMAAADLEDESLSLKGAAAANREVYEALVAREPCAHLGPRARAYAERATALGARPYADAFEVQALSSRRRCLADATAEAYRRKRAGAPDRALATFPFAHRVAIAASVRDAVPPPAELAATLAAGGVVVVDCRWKLRDAAWRAAMLEIEERRACGCLRAARHACAPRQFSETLPFDDAIPESCENGLRKALLVLRTVGEAVGDALRRSEPLDVRAPPAMIAAYTPDATYHLHKDAYGGDAEAAAAVAGSVLDRRRITLLLYVNDDGWDPIDDGGCLRVHSKAYQNGARDVTPKLGRVVAFDSRKVWHEVRPAAKDRRALTIWVDAAPAGATLESE